METPSAQEMATPSPHKVYSLCLLPPPSPIIHDWLIYPGMPTLDGDHKQGEGTECLFDVPEKHLSRNEIVSFAEMWMDLESVIQGEVSQEEKNKYRILTHICGI